MSMNIIDIDARPVFVTGLIHKDPQINFSGGSFIDFAGDGTDLMVSAEGRLTTVTVSDVVINLSNEFIFILQRLYAEFGRRVRIKGERAGTARAAQQEIEMAQKIAVAKKCKRMKRVFEEIDTDHNGTLSVDEIVVLLEHEFGTKTKGLMHSEVCVEAKKLLSKIDTSGDGQIDLAEFLSSLYNYGVCSTIKQPGKGGAFGIALLEVR